MSDPRREVLKWLDAYQTRAPGVLRDRGLEIDVLETARSPLFLALLDDARQGTGGGPDSRIRRWRGHASQLKAMAKSQRLPSAALERCDFLFWPRHRSHLDGQIPVARALRRRGAQVHFVVDGPPLVPQLTDSGFAPTVSFKAFPFAAARGWDRGRRLARKVRRQATLTTREHVALEELARQLPTISSAAARAAGLLDATRPRGLIVGNDITIEGRAATQLAKRRGIATACLMHGIGSGNPLLAHHVVDQMLLYGERDRDALVRLGARPQQLTVVGAPYLDDRPRQSGTVHPQLRAQIGDRLHVVLALSGPGDRISRAHHQGIIRAVDAAAMGLTKVQVAAKLHPKDDLAFYDDAEHILAFAAGDSRVPKSIFDWLQGASLLISAGSAVGMEAMLLDVPALTIDFDSALVELDYVVARATEYACNPADVKAALREVVDGAGERTAAVSRTRAYLHGKFGALDGGSADRAADVIYGFGAG